MKHFYTLLFALVATLSLSAKDYTDHMVITVSGQTIEQEATINVEQAAGGTYTLTLADFAFSGNVLGTIVVSDITPTEENGITILSATKTGLLFTNPQSIGSLVNTLGGISLTLQAKMTGEKLYATLNIDTTIAKNIGVVFGTDDFNTTAVEGVSVSKTAKEEAFTLSGARAEKAQKGIVILKQGDKARKVLRK